MSVPATFTHSYESIRDLTGMTKNDLFQYVHRGDLDATSLRSILLFIARHGTPQLRDDLIAYALNRRLTEKNGRRIKAKR